MTSLSSETLLIGYGNSLRGDDGIGGKVAKEASRLWGARSLIQHQLTPELALILAEVDRVIFIDAACDRESVQVQSILPEEATEPQLGHFCEPRSLLAISQLLYGHAPQAWLIGIPTVNFEFGEGFSPIAEKGASEALQIIENLLRKDENPLG